jgi:hypothetical protein
MLKNGKITSSFFLATMRLKKMFSEKLILTIVLQTVKKVSDFPVSSRDVTNQTPARESLGTG